LLCSGQRLRTQNAGTRTPEERPASPGLKARRAHVQARARPSSKYIVGCKRTICRFEPKYGGKLPPRFRSSLFPDRDLWCSCWKTCSRSSSETRREHASLHQTQLLLRDELTGRKTIVCRTKWERWETCPDNILLDGVFIFWLRVIAVTGR